MICNDYTQSDTKGLIKRPEGRAMNKYDGLEGGPSHSIVNVTDDPGGDTL